ncbi:rhamnogalacturonase A precursor [Pseudozyma hubeiensis SY62]|uniref:Rhamnogalacturonase A n=1 Tax=Pseudozyma hubeiensis (strain SY62) TaxID=1305764 RepID=R9PDT9_PSEHS|nr:rhamnogalacturonase A precursor [Pseudozyma hubeiensis SY62]GAC99548.1 rhamnogalacturonase A precursor [Pseudozyma hubeiensis SY62]
MTSGQQAKTISDIKNSAVLSHLTEGSVGSKELGIWYDSDSDSEKDGEEQEEVEAGGSEEDAGRDSDSEDSAAESSDSVSTPESSPPSHRAAVAHGQDDACSIAFGSFDANGRWKWSKVRREDAIDKELAHEDATDAQLAQPALNRHDRAHFAMTGGAGKLDGHTTPSNLFWTHPARAAQTDVYDFDDEAYDVVGYTSYHPRESSREGHSIVVPVRIRLEDDSSSDESESSSTSGTSCSTSSESSGSDPEARRRARVHMLQRLGRNVAIPQRRASAVRLGHGAAPRRPPSLDEISNRVVSGSGCTYARGTSATSARYREQQRAVSCPSPLLTQQAWFGEVHVMVTPPTPQMSSEKIPGVVFKSQHVRPCAFSTDAHGNLVAPAFDVAPGRQRMLEEREQQAKEWLQAFKEQQQRQQQQQQQQPDRQGLHLKLGAGSAAPPVATEQQVAATFAPSSPTRRKSPSSPSLGCEDEPAAPTLLLQPGGPPIPPRRRSFGGQRHASGQIKAIDVTEACVSRPPSAEKPQCTGLPVNVPGKTTSISASSGPAAAAVAGAAAPRRRSLVARLGLRKPSKEVKAAREAVLDACKTVPAAVA